MKSLILVIVSLLLFYADAQCCSCFSKERVTVSDFNSYGMIFTATLIKEVRSVNKLQRACIYKVIHAYKGVNAGEIIYVWDKEDIGACGLGRLLIGADYLVYATGEKTKWSSSCGRTTYIPAHAWPRDSIVITRLRNLEHFGRIYDTAYNNFHADTMFLNKHVLCLSKSGLQTFYDNKGRVEANGSYKNKTAEGFWTYYKDGIPAEKGKYINGKKDSLWVEPFMDKSVYIREYKEGQFTQRETFLFEGKISGKTEPVGNGEKWVEYDYHNNGRVRYIRYAKPPEKDSNNRFKEPVGHGPFKMFNKAGVMLKKGNHDNGYSVGHWQYYYDNGKLRMEGDYQNSKKNGQWKIYHPNGNIKATGNYTNDNKTGKWKYFDMSGREIAPAPESIKEDEDWFTYSG